MGKKDRRYLYAGDRSVTSNYNETVHMLNNKFYNLYRSNFETEGLSYREEQYVMNRFWDVGRVAAFNIKHTDELGYTDWSRVSWDMYGEDETVTLLNKYGSPLIPTGIQTVDKDVVIGYIQSNRKSIKMIVDWYVRRIAQVECIINTNLHMQKLPYIIPVSDQDERAKLEDVVDRILNNELVIAVDGVEPKMIQAIQTNAPYLVDKLQNYEKDIINDLLTYLGVNNNGSNKIEQLQLAEVNSNNEEINLSDDNFNMNLEAFCKRVKDVLGKDIKIRIKSPDVQMDGQIHMNEEKPGPKADMEGEE